MMRPVNAADYARLAILAAIWRASFIFMRVTAPAFGTLLTAEGRLLIAGVVLAPWIGLDTRHLSTDRFLTARGEDADRGAGLALQRLEHWRFIPQGDLPVGWGYVLRLHWVGGHLRVGVLRGGIAFSAVRMD